VAPLAEFDAKSGATRDGPGLLISGPVSTEAVNFGGRVAAWVVIDGNGNHESFDQHVNDIVFAPQGSFHYFENRGLDDMTIVIIQNTSAPEDKDNIGIGESLSRLPPRVLSAVFGVPADTFNNFKKIDNAITILRSP